MVLSAHCYLASLLCLRPLAFLVLSLDIWVLRRLKFQSILADNFTQEEMPPDVFEELQFKVAKEEV